jgi:hypothetical protein
VIPLALVSLFAQTPEATIAAFVAAFNAGDRDGMVRQILGEPRPSENLSTRGPNLQIRITESRITGKDAYVEMDLVLRGTPPNPAEPKRSHGVAHLRRKDGDWRIVPDYAGTTSALGAMAAIAIGDSAWIDARAAARATQSLSNVKQIGLATIMYSADHNDRLPSARRFKSDIMRYVSDKKIFTAPGAPKGSMSYFFDPRLSGMDTVKLRDVSATAMILQGTPAKTVYPYQGRTPVGFVDGSVRMLSPDGVLQARRFPLK